VRELGFRRRTLQIGTRKGKGIGIWIGIRTGIRNGIGIWLRKGTPIGIENSDRDRDRDMDVVR
jgi:hypothetical protein